MKSDAAYRNPVTARMRGRFRDLRPVGPKEDVDGRDKLDHDEKDAGNPSPGWGKGRDEGVPLIIEAQLRCSAFY
jgi:hypothetical protein